VSLAADAPAVARCGQAVPADHGWFEALNQAAWTDGLVIEAPAGLVLTEPVRVLVPALAGQDLLPRLLLLAGRSASLTVVEEHLGGGANGLVVGVTEILLDPGAEVRHVLVQRWQDGQRGHLTQRALLDRDARYHGAIASLGGSLAKLDLGAILAGPGARSELVGVTLPCGRQHLDHHTLHRHTAGHTWSNIDFKAAVFDRARSTYTGLIRIEKDAPVSEAYQENRNLLLTDRARVDTIPELEILTDEVSCSHGATVAPIEPEQLFYLQSRGIPGEAARRLIVRGFVEPTLRLLPEGLREEIESLIEARLDGLRRSG
jgi:Fe-S cluster assembly protein SufD